MDESRFEDTVRKYEASAQVALEVRNIARGDRMDVPATFLVRLCREWLEQKRQLQGRL